MDIRLAEVSLLVGESYWGDVPPQDVDLLLLDVFLDIHVFGCIIDISSFFEKEKYTNIWIRVEPAQP